MNTDSSKIERLFPFLRYSLFGIPISPTDIPDDLDWTLLVKTAKKQTVLPLVADAASRLDPEQLPPKEIMAQMRQFTFHNINTHSLLDRTIADVVSDYESHGIHGVLLKGQGLARLYPDPKLRQCGDIDLYVGKKNYDRACRIAIESDKYDNRDTHPSVKHYDFKAGKITVELHRAAAIIYTPWCKRRFNRILAECLDCPGAQDHVSIAGVDVSVPSPYLNTIFVYFHLAHHFLMEGVGLRQLCDWAMVLHRYSDSIDRDRLYSDLKAINMLKMWQTLGYILVHGLGLPEQEMPFYDPKARGLALKALAEIQAGGNFGHHSDFIVRNKSSNIILHKLATFSEIVKFSGRKAKFNPTEVSMYMLLRSASGVGSLFKPSEWRRKFH